ncbi:MAG: alkaline phosphatase, partial [Proteobacteria bacterium]|nr:alkaline phosphatase [Pseudomonadota bacterium]
MKSLHHLPLAAVLMLATTSASWAAGEATNVIFFLGDGMGPTTVTASRIYQYGEAGRLAMEGLRRTARIKTYSNDAQTTDSAPSMAAYMTGVKMNNEVISMSADTRAYNGSKPY